MAKEPTPEEMNKMLFMNLVMMLSTSAIQQMGKLKDPMTGKVEQDLQGAQVSIDMLTMLKEKTQGNLDERERKLLGDTLAMLQMNYVEASQTAAASAGGEAQTPPPDEADAEETPGTADEAPEGGGTPPAEPGGTGKPPHDPMYHKSYG